MQKRKKLIIIWTSFAVFVILVLFVFDYNNRVVMPTVEADGRISGNYSIESIMKLGKPYECAFQKSDGTSEINGTIYTDGSSIYGVLNIKTDLVKNGFNDFLLIKNGKAMSWTSLQNLGYISTAAKSAGRDASPLEQAQIVGTADVLPYNCAPWNTDNSLFETPGSIKFSVLK